jgi:hypothetical protein
MKRDIADTGPALPRLLDMQYSRLHVEGDRPAAKGVIAQELQTTHPEMVSHGREWAC